MRSASPGTTCQAPPGRRAPGRPWSPGSARRRRLRPAMHPDQTGRHEAPTDSSPGRAQTSGGQADAGASRRPRLATAIADTRWFRPARWPCFPTYQSGRLARPALAVSGRAADEDLPPGLLDVRAVGIDLGGQPRVDRVSEQVGERRVQRRLPPPPPPHLAAPVLRLRSEAPPPPPPSLCD